MLDHELDRALALLRRTGKDPLWALRMRAMLRYRSLARELISIHDFLDYANVGMGGLGAKVTDLLRQLTNRADIEYAQMEGTDNMFIWVSLQHEGAGRRKDAICRFSYQWLRANPVLVCYGIVASMRAQLKVGTRV